jgi:hypothetical protein
LIQADRKLCEFAEHPSAQKDEQHRGCHQLRNVTQRDLLDLGGDLQYAYQQSNDKSAKQDWRTDQQSFPHEFVQKKQRAIGPQAPPFANAIAMIASALRPPT